MKLVELLSFASSNDFAAYNAGKTGAGVRRCAPIALKALFGFLAGKWSRSHTQWKLVAMAAGLILLSVSSGEAKVQVNRKTSGAKLFLQGQAS